MFVLRLSTNKDEERYLSFFSIEIALAVFHLETPNLGKTIEQCPLISHIVTGSKRGRNIAEAYLSFGWIQSFNIPSMQIKEVAEELNISLRTVETHKSKILLKLGFSRITDLVKFAIKEGLAELWGFHHFTSPSWI